MLTVVLGAGASHDSDPARPPDNDSGDWRGNPTIRPPLANQLFNPNGPNLDVLRRFPECAAVIDDIRSSVAAGEQIEQKLAELEAESSFNPYWSLHLLAIRYYLRDVVLHSTLNWMEQCAGVTNYARLVLRLAMWSEATRKRVAYVTFNYDNMLERAFFSATGRRFPDVLSYTEPIHSNTSRVFKVHGSCNWDEIVEMPFEDLNHEPMNYTETDVLGRWWQVKPSSTIEVHGSYPRSKSQIGIPAIAVPAADKTGYVLPQPHEAQLHQTLAQTEAVLVIGWKGQDPHFVADLQMHLRPGVNLRIANGGAAYGQETIELLKGHGLDKVHFDSLDMGFSELVRLPGLKDVFSAAVWPDPH